MPDTLLSFLPVIGEDADSVRARYDADANAGLDPSDPAYADTTEGGFFWECTQPSVLEAVRLWGFLGTEVVAAAFPGTAWGDYLDLHGETLDLPRLDEVQATGDVLFTGAIGTLIPSGTQVSTVQADPSSSEDPVVFNTDRTITLVATPGPVNLAAAPLGTGGTLAAGVYYYALTAIGANGETVASNEVTVTLSGSTSSVPLSWTAFAGATGYKVYRGSAAGGEELLATLGVVTAYTDDGSAVITPTVLVPTNSVSITAATAGTSGNVGSGTITQVVSPVAGAPAVTNTQATSGGADLESDDRYRQRIEAEYGKAAGAGNIYDYQKWALEVPQVGYVSVQPLWNGAGTVRVIITDQQNHPNSSSIVQELQARLDPVPGQGQGQAPIGAIVTVATPSLLVVNTVGAITHDSGYSLDGTAGTVPTRAAIQDAVSSYLNTLPPGSAVVLNAVIRQMMEVPGVHDVTGVTLNGSAANVAVGALQVAEAGTVTLS